MKNMVSVENEGRARTQRRMNIKEIFAIDVVVGEVSEMYFVERHLGRVVDVDEAREEREQDDSYEDVVAPLGDFLGLLLREGLVGEEHVEAELLFLLEERKERR